MEIKVCLTSEWNDKTWDNYCTSFNNVFKKDLKVSDFKQKYTTVADGHSYHAILYNDDLDIVGSCTVVPFIYKKCTELIKIGQAVDVFILEAYRTDPLMLRRMYVKLKKCLIMNNIVAVMAVPNATIHSYWKNVVKWKDVGNLRYWVLPIRLGNILKKPKILNLFSFFLVNIWVLFNKFLSLIINKKEKKSLYELRVDDTFINNRYTKNHQKVIFRDITFYYRIYNEEGIQTAYLIDAIEGNRTSFKALIKASNYIIKNTNADLILYVGSLKLFQTLFLKVPKKFEPKELPLTCDILDKINMNTYSDMLEIKNWNFGLMNYDVR